MRITFLGTGTSHGVPSIDCMINGFANCPKGVCKQSAFDPRHNRTRSSILVETENVAILIDVSADFRQQALREQIGKIDAVLITHSHADHICGIPDIRSYTRGETVLPFYGSNESIQNIRNTFSYIFNSQTFVGGGIPRISTQDVKGPFELFGETVIPVKVEHGNLDGCFGYRIGKLAYIPDMKSIQPSELKKLEGTEILILNCLRDKREHSTHLILPQSIELARSIAPKCCCFIHMCHDIHYELDSASLDPWMEFSYDGLKMEI